jgi:beta-galactosidase/beta-glucuronidase
MSTEKHNKGAFRIILILLISCNVAGQPVGRQVQNFNSGWKFYKGEIADGQKSGLDDSGWRLLDLPHDWSIEGPFSKANFSCTAYLPGGIGWYRKTFIVPENERTRKVFIYFDGVYNNSEVWINGNYLGKRPNGYISFQYDLTPFINFGKENLVAVRVDHSLYGDSRWYTGSGIYRNVKLITEEMVHIKQWGIYCKTSDITPSGANLSADISAVNETDKAVRVSVISTLIFNNITVGTANSKIAFKPGEEKTINQTFKIDNPKLWDTEDPNLYSLVTEIKGRELLDKTVTKVEIRS